MSIVDDIRANCCAPNDTEDPKLLIPVQIRLTTEEADDLDMLRIGA